MDAMNYAVALMMQLMMMACFELWLSGLVIDGLKLVIDGQSTPTLHCCAPMVTLHHCPVEHS